AALLVSLFLLLLPAPPISPLFPYTTLFRSNALGALAGAALAALTFSLAPETALADPHPITPGLVNPDPSNNTPNVLDGHVDAFRSEEHTSELQSLTNILCRLLLEKQHITTL